MYNCICIGHCLQLKVSTMPVSLHTHSWHSALEGTSSLEALLDRSGLWLHGPGVDRHQQSVRCRGVHGTCFPSRYQADSGSMPALRKEASISSTSDCLCYPYERAVALIADQMGYRNLCRILSRLHLNALHP